MIAVSLTDVDDIYVCAAVCDVSRHYVACAEFRSFFRHLRHFQDTLKSAALDEEEDWHRFVRPLTRYRFNACALPLRFSHPALCSSATVDMLNQFPKYAIAAYGHEIGTAAREVVEEFRLLQALDKNPLLDALTGMSIDPQAGIVIAANPAFFADVEGALSYRLVHPIPVLSPAQLQQSACFGQLFVFGRSKWFPPSTFTAPRACDIRLITYRWLPDVSTFESAFATTDSPTIRIRDVTRDGPGDQWDIADAIELPRIDLAAAVARVSQARPHTSDEETEALLMLLEGAVAVYIEADNNVTVDVIDLDDDKRYVKRVSPSAIAPGMFLLLRTGGGGDYIVTVADQVLGQQAGYLRKAQREWKRDLKAKVRQLGIGPVIERLTGLGSTVASYSNLRNWMGERNIRTEDYTNFEAIMRLIGRNDRECADCWRSMGTIDSAHRKAGRYIRQMLYREVRGSNIEELERFGRKEFNLGDLGGGSLTAIRILHINREPVPVHPGLIRDPIALDGD